MTLLNRNWHDGTVMLITLVLIPVLMLALVIVTAWLVVLLG